MVLPGLDVKVVSRNGVVRLTAVGEIDAATEERFGRAVRDAVFEAQGDVDLDLSQVSFMGSDGISALIRARRLSQERGVTLRIAKASHQVERVLELMGLGGAFEPSDEERSP